MEIIMKNKKCVEKKLKLHWCKFCQREAKLLVHFPEIHRSVLRKITIDLLYFWDVYDVNLWEKNFGRSTAHSCRTYIFK